MNSREVIRCSKCRLVMFLGKRLKCPRCAGSLYDAPEVEPPPIQLVPCISHPATIGLYIKARRLRLNLGQKDLAKRMGCGRTYVSKIERGWAEPTIPLAQRFADALECRIADLLPALTPVSQDAPDDPALVAFMAQIFVYIGQLTGEQMVAIRRRARQLAEAKCAQVVIANNAQEEAS